MVFLKREAEKIHIDDVRFNLEQMGSNALAVARGETTEHIDPKDLQSAKQFYELLEQPNTIKKQREIWAQNEVFTGSKYKGLRKRLQEGKLLTELATTTTRLTEGELHPVEAEAQRDLKMATLKILKERGKEFSTTEYIGTAQPGYLARQEFKANTSNFIEKVKASPDLSESYKSQYQNVEGHKSIKVATEASLQKNERELEELTKVMKNQTGATKESTKVNMKLLKEAIKSNKTILNEEGVDIPYSAVGSYSRSDKPDEPGPVKAFFWKVSLKRLASKLMPRWAVKETPFSAAAAAAAAEEEVNPRL